MLNQRPPARVARDHPQPPKTIAVPLEQQKNRIQVIVIAAVVSALTAIATVQLVHALVW